MSLTSFCKILTSSRFVFVYNNCFSVTCECRQWRHFRNLNHVQSSIFHFELGISATETCEMMMKLSTEKTMSRTNVFEWYRRFRDGRECCEDDSRCGRRSSLNATLITTVKDVVSWDRRVMICDICDEMYIITAPCRTFSQRN
jgi:hypothetical protein